MSNKLIFRILGAASSAIVIISLFVPFTQLQTEGLWDIYNGQGMLYVPIIILAFAIFAVISFSLNVKPELSFISFGAFLFFIIVKSIRMNSDGTFSSISLGFFLLALGTVFTGIMTLLCNLGKKTIKNVSMENSNLNELSISNSNSTDLFNPAIPSQPSAVMNQTMDNNIGMQTFNSFEVPNQQSTNSNLFETPVPSMSVSDQVPSSMDMFSNTNVQNIQPINQGESLNSDFNVNQNVVNNPVTIDTAIPSTVQFSDMQNQLNMDMNNISQIQDNSTLMGDFQYQQNNNMLQMQNQPDMNNSQQLISNEFVQTPSTDNLNVNDINQNVNNNLQQIPNATPDLNAAYNNFDMQNQLSGVPQEPLASNINPEINSTNINNQEFINSQEQPPQQVMSNQIGVNLADAPVQNIGTAIPEIVSEQPLNSSENLVQPNIQPSNNQNSETNSVPNLDIFGI